MSSSTTPLMHNIFAGGVPTDLEKNLKSFVNDFCTWIDASFGKEVPPTSVLSFCATSNVSQYLNEVFLHMATVRDAFTECARNTEWHMEYQSAFMVIGNKWQERSDSFFGSVSAESDSPKGVLGFCSSSALTVHCVSVEAPSRAPRSKQLVGFTELDLTFGSADSGGAAVRYRYEATPVDAAALEEEAAGGGARTRAQCITAVVTQHVRNCRGIAPDGSLSDKFLSLVERACEGRTGSHADSAREPTQQKPVTGDLVKWSTQHWALCVGALEHLYAILGGSAAELGDLLALFCAHLVYEGAARAPQDATTTVDGRHDEVRATKDNAMVVLQYVSQYLARRMTTVRDGGTCEHGAPSSVSAKGAWMRMVSHTLVTCRKRVCTLQQMSVTRMEVQPRYDRIREDALRNTHSVLGNVKNFSDFPGGSAPTDLSRSSAGAGAATIERTAAYFERIILNSLIIYLRPVDGAKMLTPETERHWPEMDVAELSTLFQAYTSLVKTNVWALASSGCKWVNETSAEFGIALCHLALSVLASKEMRLNFRELRDFTLVPHQNVWCDLLKQVSVSSTSLKRLAMYLHTALSRECDKKLFMYEPQEGISRLTKNYSNSREEFHKKWAMSRAKVVRTKFFEDTNSLLELKEFVEMDYEDDDENRPTKNQLKKAHQRLNQLKKCTYHVQLLPFTTPAQSLVWDLPEKLLSYFKVSENCLVSLTGVDLTEEDRGCVFHCSDPELPQGVTSKHIPKWIHMHENFPKSLHINAVRAKETFLRKPMSGTEIVSSFSDKGVALATKYLKQNVPNACFLRERKIDVQRASSRGNRSYCERPLCTGLTREQSSELYACRSYTSLQLSRFLQALRGSCKVVAPLFETEALVQQFVVAVLSDVEGYLSRDAAKVYEQLDVTDDIGRMSAHYACTLLFYACMYGFAPDYEVSLRVVRACVRRTCELIDQLRRSAATDKHEVRANWQSIHRLASIGIACFSFVSEEHFFEVSRKEQKLVEDVATLVLTRHHATVMASGIPTRFFSCFDGEALLLLYRCMSHHATKWQPLTSILNAALGRIGCALPAGRATNWKVWTKTASFVSCGANDREELFVDLYSGEVRVKGLPFGGLTKAQCASAAFSMLFSSENQMEVAPGADSRVTSVLNFPQFLPPSDAAGPDSASEGSAHFVFSAAGDVGLCVKCASFELDSFFSTTPLCEDIGVARHYHFYGTYRVRGADGAWVSYRIVLFKPMPPRGRSWFEWTEGMHLIDYVALQAVGETPLAEFTVYAVPRSRKADILAVLPAVQSDLEVVVMHVGVRQRLADAFDCDAVDIGNMIVCVLNGTVTVDLPQLHEKFTLRDGGVYTRQVYRLAAPGVATRWLPAWRPGKKRHLALLRDEAMLHTVPITYALAAPQELVLWPVVRDAASAPLVVEVSRHEHFGYLETHTDQDTLHLCLALLREYPSRVPVFEDGLTTADVVCGLLARCATNVSYTEGELSVLLAVHACVATLPGGGGVVRVWLDALTQAREEMAPFYDHTRGAGDALVQLREEVQKKTSDTCNEYASYYVELVRRGLLTPRVALPPELMSFTRCAHTAPCVSAGVRGLPSTPLMLTRAMRRMAQNLRAEPAASVAVVGTYAADLYKQREELLSAAADVSAAQAAGILAQLASFSESLQKHKAAVARALPCFYEDLQLSPRAAALQAAAEETERVSLEEERLLLHVLREAAPSAAMGTSLQEVAALASGLQDATSLPGSTMARLSASYGEELRALCVCYVAVCCCLGWCTRLRQLLSRAVEDARRTSSADAATAAWQPFFLELSSPRCAVEECVPWLVYEAEQNVSIRGVQYETWKLMSDRSQHALKTVTQLHMGEGKTRVVVPMLILSELCDAGREGERRLPCVMALSAVSEELRQHLHRSLGSPGLRVRVLQKPFSRDVPFTDATLDRLLGSFGRFNRAAVVERREYFNSFTQKREELVELCDCDVGRLREHAVVLPPPPARLFGDNALYILDEADELLGCRYNLIYSAGERADLDQREQRWALIQQLLKVCAKVVREFPFLFELFTLPKRGSGDGESGSCATAGYPVFVLGRGALVNDVERLIFAEFVASAPASFAWMSLAPVDVERLVFADHTTPASCLAARPFTRDMVAQIMLLRGFFRLGLLRFVLSQRFNVTFGLAPLRPTRMAVPYVAADVPSRRNEFAQPDVAATLTFVSYLVTGLDYERFREALTLLSQLPVSQRASEYERWIDGVDGDFPLSAEMIDLQNASEVRYLWSRLRHSDAVVGYWVRRAVLEKEGRYHDKMLRSTAWDIADQRRVVGFSGTKDACQLMPSGVSFEENADARISGSTERASRVMPLHTRTGLQRLSRFAEEVRGAHSTAAFGPATQAHTYIRAAVRLGCDVLVDLGALLAGLSLEVVAAYVCGVLEEKRLTAMHLGVCFFDAERERWAVMDTHTRTVEPLTQSHVTAADCFVVYDQARCRGADLRLRGSACALVSLAPETQRDDLVQAVGRLRAFGRGQTVCFVAPDSVVDAVAGVRDGAWSQVGVAGEADCARVLRWAVANTDRAIFHGVFDFIDAAAHFYFKRSSWKRIAEGKGARGTASHFVVASPTDASSLYGRSAVPVKVKAYAVRMLLETQRIDANLRNTDCMATYKRIEAMFGERELQKADASALVMEREVEQEKEVEQEAEVEERLYEPVAEIAVNVARSPGMLNSLISFSTWCETVAGLPLRTPSNFNIYFTPSFEKMVKDELRSPSVSTRKGGISGVPTRVLRRISYFFLHDVTTAIVLTELQAHVLLDDVNIEVVHSPTNFTFLIPSALVRDVKPESIVSSEGCRCLQVLASFFNGETYYTAEQCPLLLDIIRPALMKARTSTANVANRDAGAKDFFDETNLFYFLHCRRLYNLLPDSVLAELCHKELHEEVLKGEVNSSTRVPPLRAAGFVELSGI